jgi:hypothetical protein
MNAVLCKEGSLVLDQGRVVHADAYEATP